MAKMIRQFSSATANERQYFYNLYQEEILLFCNSHSNSTICIAVCREIFWVISIIQMERLVM